MKWFGKCKTLEDVKKLYKTLAKKLHPDCGGNEEEFKAMKAEYEEAFEKLKNFHQNSSGEYYQKRTNESARAYADIIEAIIKFDGITIELVGSWLWIFGNSFPYRETFRALGFTWSKAKRAWFYTGEFNPTGRPLCKGHHSMNGIRNMFGSEIIKEAQKEKEKVKKLAMN